MNENSLDFDSEASSESSSQSRRSFYAAHKLLSARVFKFLKRRKAGVLVGTHSIAGIEFNENSEFEIPMRQKSDPVELDHPVGNLISEEH